METEGWSINEGKEFRKKVLPAGRYECILAKIEQIRVKINPKYWPEDTPMPEDGKSPKLLVVFEPTGVEKSDDEDCQITTLVKPSNHEKSNCYKLLCSMSESGTIPEDVRKDARKYKEYAENMIGSLFLVGSKPSENGMYNNLTNVVPAPKVPQIPQSVPIKKSPSAMEESPTGVDLKIYSWDLTPLASETKSLQRAEALLRKSGAREKGTYVWSGTTAVPQLAKYVTETQEDIPF